MAAFEILCGFIVFFLAFYYYLVKPHEYWEKRGIPGPKPQLLFGNFFPVIFGRVSIGDQVMSFYKQYKHEPVFGLFIRTQRILAINDPDLIKTVLIKDFSKFSNRGLAVNEVVSTRRSNFM